MIASPGIVPAHRDDGLYLPLLQHAMQWIPAQEPLDIELESWGDDARTLALYQEFGFVITRQAATYRLDLR